MTYSTGAIEAPVYTILQRTNKFQHIHVLPTCKLTNTKWWVVCLSNEAYFAGFPNHIAIQFYKTIFSTNDSEPTEVISQLLISDGKLSEQLSIVYLWETHTIRFLIENLERCSHIRYTVNCCQQVVYPRTDCYDYVSWYFLLWWDRKLFIVVPMYLLYHFKTIIVY